MTYAINVEPHQALIGHRVTVRGRVCEVVAVEIRKKGEKPVTALTWRVDCATCGKPFHFVTGLLRERVRLRCDRCKCAGKPVTPRQRGVKRKTDDELRGIVLNVGAVYGPQQVAEADLELQRRRKLEIRALRWDMEHGNAHERRAAERKLRKYRATPTEGIRIKRKRHVSAPPAAPSIFD